MSCIYGDLADTRGVGDCQPGMLPSAPLVPTRPQWRRPVHFDVVNQLPMPQCTCVESKWLPWCSVLCKHLNSPVIGIRNDNGGDGGGLLIPALYRYLTSSEWLEHIIPLRHMNCLRGGRVVTRDVGACQSDSHRRLWWRRAVVATAFIFPRSVKLITDFIELYNIYITILTERNCWKCLRFEIRENTFNCSGFNDTSLLDCCELYIILTSCFTTTCSLLLGILLAFYYVYCIMLLHCMLTCMYFVRND